MKEANENDDIKKLRQLKWKTHLSKQLEEFSEVISGDEIFEKYFGKSFAEKLAAKSREITKTVLKLSVVYVVLMLSLYAFHNAPQSELEIFGYGFKNIDAYKELLLLLAVSIQPIVAVMSAYQKYINSLINECIKKLSPDEKVRKFYSHTFFDSYFDWVAVQKTSPSTYWHGFSVFMLALLGVTLICMTNHLSRHFSGIP